MKTNYFNWVPKYMLKVLKCISIIAWILTAILVYQYASTKGSSSLIWLIVCIVVSIISSFMLSRFTYMYKIFDFNDPKAVSWRIIHLVSDHMVLEPNSKILDVGCGSGALSIDVAKKNASSTVIGCDRWGSDYKDFSNKVCVDNAKVEGVTNVTFMQADATKLPFNDNEFDGLVSNYVYHNIPGNRTEYLIESLRCLKPGGKFAIHDLFTKQKYGDLKQLETNLKKHGVKKLEFIDTTDGKGLTPIEARKSFCVGSKLLIGSK